MTTPTDKDLIEKYIAVDHYIKQRNDTLAKELQPYEKLQDAIKGTLMLRLHERGADNTKTDAGTAYISRITNFTVTDEDAFLQFILKYPSLRDCMKIAPVKDPIKEYMNGSTEPPPGIEQSQYVRLNIRRT